MGLRIRGVMRGAIAFSLGLVGLAGCQNFQHLTGYAPSQTGSTTGLEGNSILQSSEPKIKNMRGTNAEKLEAFTVAADKMEAAGSWAEAIYYYEQIRQIDPRRNLEC